MILGVYEPLTETAAANEAAGRVLGHKDRHLAIELAAARAHDHLSIVKFVVVPVPYHLVLQSTSYSSLPIDMPCWMGQLAAQLLERSCATAVQLQAECKGNACSWDLCGLQVYNCTCKLTHGDHLRLAKHPHQSQLPCLGIPALEWYDGLIRRGFSGLNCLGARPHSCCGLCSLLLQAIKPYQQAQCAQRP